MGAVWSKVGGDVEKHDGPKPMMAAAIRVNFAVNVGGASVDDCAIYKRNPEKYPDEPNILPSELEKARKGATKRR